MRIEILLGAIHAGEHDLKGVALAAQPLIFLTKLGGRFTEEDKAGRKSTYGWARISVESVEQQAACMARLLLEQGANPDETDGKDGSALLSGWWEHAS